MMYVEVPSQHHVVDTGLACLIMSTICFFIVATNKTIISCIWMLESNYGVVLYTQCWTVSSASPCSYSEHCPNYEMWFFSKSTHLTEHITLIHAWYGNHKVTHTNQVTQDPYIIWQLLLVTCLCCSAACVCDQLYGYVNMINTPTGSVSWQLWDKVKVMTQCKVDSGAVLPCR